MKPIIFENEDGTQKVIFEAKSTGEDYEFTMNFEPKLGEQDIESIHFIMANSFFSSLSEKSITNIEL